MGLAAQDPGTFLAANSGPLAVEFSSRSKSVRLTSTSGAVLAASGSEAIRDLLALASARKLWAQDAATQEREHFKFLQELGNPRIHCALTVDRALAPARDKPTPPSGQALAQLVASFAGASPVAKRHALDAEYEDYLWRAVARRGYLLHRQDLAIERRTRHHELADFAREYGVDIRRSDELKSEWLAARGVKFTRTEDYGWSRPSSCDISAMPEQHTEAWEAYSKAHLTLKRVQILDGLARRQHTDGRVRPLIRTNQAVSGRMAVRDPGMQSIPTELRHVFVVEPGFDLIGFDHSNAELRVLARLMGDAAFTKRVLHGDPYAEIAEVTGRTRNEEKWRLLAFSYGQQEDSLAEIVGVEQAHATHEAIKSLFPEIPQWCREQTARARRGETLTTLSGRPLPKLTGRPRERFFKAANLLVQGSARDAFGLGVRRAAERLGESNLWFPLHDELFVLSPKGHNDETAAALDEAMTIDLGEGVVLTGTPKVYRGRWGK